MKKNSIPKLELVFLLLLTGMCPQAHATDDGRNASPQKTYAVDLTLGSATVLTFTEAVTSQTGVLFSYESALSQMPLGDVSVHETAAPLEHILEKVFKGRGFRYKVVDRIVVLTYDTDSARSQLVLVTGRVKDGSGMPLVGASVVVKDTMRGVSAGAEGNYRIFADPDATLVFSYIGYADREERIGTRSAIDVVLEEYEAVLEDVVVVGYGTQSRRTVTAAISKFDGHLLEGIPVNSVGDALKGRVPGVRVATTDATPGADPKFLIRGGSSINQSNDPIVLVDGVVREMAGLNPNDIESVSFLKDAAAAGIYGSRASNGVILITTKKGSKHLGPRIVFEGQWAWASPATKFDLMNARDYILTVRPALMEGYCGGMDPASVLGGEQSAGTGNTARSLWTTRYLRLPMGRRPGEPRAHHRLRGQRPAEPMVRRRMLAELLRRHRRGRRQHPIRRLGGLYGRQRDRGHDGLFALHVPRQHDLSGDAAAQGLDDIRLFADRAADLRERAAQPAQLGHTRALRP